MVVLLAWVSEFPPRFSWQHLISGVVLCHGIPEILTHDRWHLSSVRIANANSMGRCSVLGQPSKEMTSGFVAQFFWFYSELFRYESQFTLVQRRGLAAQPEQWRYPTSVAIWFQVNMTIYVKKALLLDGKLHIKPRECARNDGNSKIFNESYLRFYTWSILDLQDL